MPLVGQESRVSGESPRVFTRRRRASRGPVHDPGIGQDATRSTGWIVNQGLSCKMFSGGVSNPAQVAVISGKSCGPRWTFAASDDVMHRRSNYNCSNYNAMTEKTRNGYGSW